MRLKVPQTDYKSLWGHLRLQSSKHTQRSNESRHCLYRAERAWQSLRMLWKSTGGSSNEWRGGKSKLLIGKLASCWHLPLTENVQRSSQIIARITWHRSRNLRRWVNCRIEHTELSWAGIQGVGCIRKSLKILRGESEHNGDDRGPRSPWHNTDEAQSRGAGLSERPVGRSPNLLRN